MSIRIFFLALHHISKLNVLNYVSVFHINNLLFFYIIFFTFTFQLVTVVNIRCCY